MQLFPEIAHLYKVWSFFVSRKGFFIAKFVQHDIGWSPMLLTDLSDEDGIWVRVNGPADYIGEIFIFVRTFPNPIEKLDMRNFIN